MRMKTIPFSSLGLRLKLKIGIVAKTHYHQEYVLIFTPHGSSLFDKKIVRETDQSCRSWKHKLTSWLGEKFFSDCWEHTSWPIYQNTSDNVVLISRPGFCWIFYLSMCFIWTVQHTGSGIWTSFVYMYSTSDDVSTSVIKPRITAHSNVNRRTWHSITSVSATTLRRSTASWNLWTCLTVEWIMNKPVILPVPCFFTFSFPLHEQCCGFSGVMLTAWT